MGKFFTFISIIFSLIHYQFDPDKAITNPKNNYPQEDTSKKISINERSNSVTIINAIIKRKVDTALLLNTSKEILKVIKARDYNKLASFVYPKYGVRFSPYGHIYIQIGQVFSPNRLSQLANQNKHINRGSSWDQGMEPEFLTIDQYFKKYVYDVDFLNAPIKSINKFRSRGTELNNINEIYPGSDVVEFYFPGFKKKLDGMDFRGLRLVFKFYNKKLYLVVIVHDEWTP